MFRRTLAIILHPRGPHYSTLSTAHSWFITGFSDAEGCFFLRVGKRNTSKTGYRVDFCFSIGLHQKDQALLEFIQLSLGGIGNITTKHGKDSIQYRVYSHQDLLVLIDHFDKFPLMTQKRADYELFKQAFNLVSRKEHLAMEGLNQIVAIRASVNLGLSEKLKEAFPDVVPVNRPPVTDQKIHDPN